MRHVYFALSKIANDKKATVAIACSFAVHFAIVNTSDINHLSLGSLVEEKYKSSYLLAITFTLYGANFTSH
jgi:hypothetical protein